jgi:hypothetical protein
MIRANTLDELEPLLSMCRMGRVFDVQAWISENRPVALPADAGARGARRNPVRMAIDSGFHSLLQVLLEAGAPVREGRYRALEHAVEMRRPDLAALLLKHGASAGDVSMRFVVEMWHPETMELLVKSGASLVSGQPIAWGLINKVRTTLGLLKKYAPSHPEVIRQAEIALRHHAFEGDAKWVSLLLWAGANPWARGPHQVDDDGSEESGSEDEEEEDAYANAVELALYVGNMDILTHKKMMCPPDESRPDSLKLLERACSSSPNSLPLSWLLERGHSPKLLADRGTRAISSLLYSMSWDFSFNRNQGLFAGGEKPGMDSERSKERLKMIHMLIAHGGMWLPSTPQAIADARKCLLKMSVDYVLEFVWLLQKFGAARRRDVQELIRTPSMVRHLGEERTRAARLVADIPEEPLTDAQQSTS